MPALAVSLFTLPALMKTYERCMDRSFLNRQSFTLEVAKPERTNLPLIAQLTVVDRGEHVNSCYCRSLRGGERHVMTRGQTTK